MCNRKQNEIPFELCRLHYCKLQQWPPLTFTFDVSHITNNKMFANIPTVFSMQYGIAWIAMRNEPHCIFATHRCLRSRMHFALTVHSEEDFFLLNYIYQLINMSVLSVQGLFDSAIVFCAKYKYQAKRTIELSISRNFGHKINSCLKRRKYERRSHIFRFNYVVMELVRCYSNHFELPVSPQVICRRKRLSCNLEILYPRTSANPTTTSCTHHNN